MPSRQLSNFNISSPHDNSTHSPTSSSSSHQHLHHRFSTAPPSNFHRNHAATSITIISFAVGGAIITILLGLALVLWMIRRRRVGSGIVSSSSSGNSSYKTAKVHKFGYGELKAATNSFSTEQKLGQGGFGVVFKGVLRSGQEVAVKRLDADSSQGETEFQNELRVISHVSASPYVVGLLGFCSHRKKRLLVYEYMQNRSLQEALFDDEYPIELDWNRRFKIIVDTSKALAFLHACHPVIIHGDVKPSNVLLDSQFCARIADFGLARFKTEIAEDKDVDDARRKSRSQRIKCCAEKEKRHRNSALVSSSKEKAMVVHMQEQRQRISPVKEKYHRQSISSKDSPSLFTASPESDASSSFISKHTSEIPSHCDDARIDINLLSDSDLGTNGSPFPEYNGETTPCSNKTTCKGSRTSDIEAEADTVTSHSEGCFDRLSTESGHVTELQLDSGSKSQGDSKASFGKDWWWKQESGDEISAKDYVMEWIGSENHLREKKKSSMMEVLSSDATSQATSSDKVSKERRDQSKSSEWWGGVNLQNDDSSQISADAAGVQACSKEIKTKDVQDITSTKDFHHSKRKDNMQSSSWRSASLEWWRDDNNSEQSSSKIKKTSTKDRSKSREWWKDDELANSKELKSSNKKKRDRTFSRDWWSGELLNRGVSSTPSMRGTICYVAPENGGSGVLSEKSDVYSFGVLMLVIISGRRPLQVTASPITEFERANLISWARQLAHSGDLLELVDSTLKGDFSREQATLCITVALLCLQRLPSQRPSMVEVVKMLSGELQTPPLPFRFSPSPPLRMGRRSRRHNTPSSERVQSIEFPLKG